MVFLKKYFGTTQTHQDSQISQASLANREYGVEIALVIFGYVLAFLLSAVTAKVLEIPDEIAVVVFFIFASGAVMYNLKYIGSKDREYKAVDTTVSYLSQLLEMDANPAAVLGQNGEIIYSNEAFKDILLPSNTSYLPLVISSSLELSIGDSAVFLGLFGEKKIILQQEDYNFSVKINQRRARLNVNCDHMRSFYFIRVIMSESIKNSDLLEEFDLGFVECDKNLVVKFANSKIERALGYRKNELVDLKLPVTQLVKNFDEKNPLDFFGGIDRKTLTSKYGANVDFLTSSIPQFNDLDQLVEIKIIFFPLDKISGLQSDNGKEFWLEYSWKCIFENSPYPVCLLDKHGFVTKTNRVFAKDLMGNVVGKNFSEMVSDKDRSKVEKIILDHSTNIFKSNTPIPLKLKSSEKFYDIYFGQIFNLEDEFDGFLMRLSDVSKQKELEESFSHAQRMQTIGHLVGSVAHDFNNILTAISGFCDLLLLRHGPGDSSFANIMQIKQSADRASNLVKRLLAFSRKQTLKLVVINPNDLFSSFYQLIHRLIGSGVIFKQKIAPDCWNIMVDLVQIEQVILNLVVNAHQAMPKGGELILNVENFSLTNRSAQLRDLFIPAGEEMPPKGDYIKIVVEDTGAGISPEILPKIFEPFFTTKSDKSGTGLGLSTVYGIIRQSDGYIFVKTKLGVGTRFIILFKKAEHIHEQSKPELIKTSKELPKLNNSVDNSKFKIALIDDEEAIRIFAKNVLSNKGYDVIDFPSAKVAYETLGHGKLNLDLIITDVIMPEMNGPTFIEKIRENNDIKVIFISGYAEEAFTEEYGEKREFHFLPKPFSLKDLANKVSEVLNDQK